MSKPSGVGIYLLIEDNGTEGHSVSRHKTLKEIEERIQAGDVHGPFILAEEIPFKLETQE